MAVDEGLLNDPEFLQEAVGILKRDITALRKDLNRFGGHTTACWIYGWRKEAIVNEDAMCDCGYLKAQERWK